MGINNYYFNNIGARLWDVDNQDFWLSSDNQGQCLNYAPSNYDGCTGDFDTNDFNSTSYNRGWITFDYIKD